MKCGKCGHELSDHAEFCSWCGTYTGQETGTLLNGVRIDTKNYRDTVPVGDDSLLAQLKRNSRANMNGSKTRRTARANMNGSGTRRTTRANIKSSGAHHTARANHTSLNGTGVGAQSILHRIIAAVGYLGWAGFLIAVLLGHKKNSFIRFHLNAALIVNLCELCGVLAQALGAYAIAVILTLVFIIGAVYGIFSALCGRMHGLPVLSRIRLIR